MVLWGDGEELFSSCLPIRGAKYITGEQSDFSFVPPFGV